MIQPCGNLSPGTGACLKNIDITKEMVVTVIAELVMHVMGWDTVWYAHPGSMRIAVKDARFFVSISSGKDCDMVCFRRPKNRFDEVEVERCLSPGGRTILRAALAALLRHFRFVRFPSIKRTLRMERSHG